MIERLETMWNCKVQKKNEKKIKIEKFKKKKNCRDKGNYENGIRKKQ